jgi:hypothetical protein
MRCNAVVSLLLAAIAFHPLTGRAQGTFPRNWKEAVALRIFDWYQQDKARLATLEADLIKAKGFISEVAPASTMVGTAIDQDDVARRNELNAEIALLRERMRRREVSWGKNRSEPNAPERSFAWRYGPLSGGAAQIRSAILNFPFDGSNPQTTTASRPARAIPGAQAESLTPSSKSPKIVEVSGTWEILNAGTDSPNYVNVSAAGGQFNATSSYTVKGIPHSWKMTATMTPDGKVVGESFHSALPKPIPRAMQLSPDGKQFTGTFGTWVRR